MLFVHSQMRANPGMIVMGSSKRSSSIEILSSYFIRYPVLDSRPFCLVISLLRCTIVYKSVGMIAKCPMICPERRNIRP